MNQHLFGAFSVKTGVIFLALPLFQAINRVSLIVADQNRTVGLNIESDGAPENFSIGRSETVDERRGRRFSGRPGKLHPSVTGGG